MTQLQETIRDKITKYSDACGMCTDTTKECDTCGITCVLEDLNELQKLADNHDSVRPTAEWIEAPDEGADGSWEACFAVHGNPDGQHHSTNIARIVARGALNEISHNYL